MLVDCISAGVAENFGAFGANETFLSRNIKGEPDTVDKMIDELVAGTASLSRQKIGALIVLERKTGINEIIQTGTYIDGEVSRQLLINIFIPNTPLHDGSGYYTKEQGHCSGVFFALTGE